MLCTAKEGKHVAIVHKLEPVRYDYKQLRVAAYARVSSKSDDQKNSFAAQVSYYRNLISTYPNYVFVGIYADATDILGLKQNPTKRASL